MFKISLKKSKELLKGKRLTFWGVIIIYFSVLMATVATKDVVIMNVASFLVGMPAAFGFMRYMINLYHKKEKLEDLVYYFENYTKNFKLILATLWYTMIVCIGFCLLIVPGIIWAYRYVLVFYILLTDERVSIKKSFEMSKEKMHGHKFKYFAATIVLAIAPLILIFMGTFSVALASFNLAEENPDALAKLEDSVFTLANQIEHIDNVDYEFDFDDVKDDVYQELDEIVEDSDAAVEEIDVNEIKLNHNTSWGSMCLLVVGIILLAAGWIWFILLSPRLCMIETVYGMELLAKDKKEEVKE
ncbi:MAG: DUF975 family protein [Clostridia bacterium]|nr:DUF975 family protein [Clostridia bacterium]